MAEKIARRRLPGATATVGSTSASMPRCANAAATCARFHSRYAGRATCSSAQVPQRVKLGQSGATRSAIAEVLTALVG